MKALKEKRVSLRSFLRRGLVILSLFALVFASCNDGSSTDPTDPTNPTDPTSPPAKYPLSIEVITQPKNASYQGMPPDIEGVELRVLWNQGGYETITGDLRKQGFAPSPDYCDEPGVGWRGTSEPDCDRFRIIYNGAYVTDSEELKVPGVVWLNKVTASKGPALYADDVPNLSSVTLTLDYIYYRDPDKDPIDDDDMFDNPSNALSGVDDPKLVTKQLTRTVTGAYPPFRFTPQQTGYNVPSINIGIGLLKVSGLDDLSVDPDDLASVSWTGSPTNPKAATIKLEAFYQVTGIKWSGQNDSKFFMFDDDTHYAEGTKKDDDGVDRDSKWWLEKFVKDAELKFEVSYSNGEKRTKTWKDFKDNVSYAYAKKGITVSANDIFWGADVTTTDPERTMIPSTYGNAEPTKVLQYNDDNQNRWTFWMEYVPQEYIENGGIGGSGTAHGYTARFPVEVPIYEFNGVKVERAKGYTSNYRQELPTDPSTYNGPSGTGPMSEDLAKYLTRAWVLTGTYSWNKTVQTKEIGLTSVMFYHGVDSSGNWFKLDLDDGDDGTISGRYDSGGGIHSSVIVNRNYPLPGWYRDADIEGVVIDVFYQYP